MPDIITYIPEKKPRRALVYQLILFFMITVSTALSASFPQYKWTTQAVFVICSVLFIKNVVRYFMYSYKYVLTEKSFVVVQQCGKKEQSVCNLALANTKAVLTSYQFRKRKKEIGHIKTTYNYTQNFMSENKVYYIFEFNNSYSCVVFEAEDSFIQQFIKLSSLCADTDISSFDE
ncbi:MAG: hypothetical protein IJO74_05325 [Clostridia bacterium]|nr:hypothetical protein [Clostridia bacterium]